MVREGRLRPVRGLDSVPVVPQVVALGFIICVPSVLESCQRKQEFEAIQKSVAIVQRFRRLRMDPELQFLVAQARRQHAFVDPAAVFFCAPHHAHQERLGPGLVQRLDREQCLLRQLTL